MNYFKIVENGAFVGVITSNNFMRYLPITDCFMRTTEQYGEYVSYDGKFYRATWMQPIVKLVNYIEAFILAITKEEYDAFIAAIEANEEIEQEEQEEEIVIPEEPIKPYEDPNDVISLNFIKQSKLGEMSLACRRTIESGFDLMLRGENHHFSLNTQDQLNLISLSAMAQTQSLIPYHADGEECIFYTSEEINEIVETATSFKIYHTTYYNALKTYINALTTIEEINAIEYGTEIPEQYKSDVLKVLEG